MKKKYFVTLSMVAVLSLASFTGCSSSNNNTTTTDTVESSEQSAAYVDGTYTKTADEADNGYTYTVTMEVSDGKITSIDWDATDADGNSKKQLALDGSYVMTEDGLNWAEQSEALANYVIENQSLDGLTTDENGKTDAVAGVSISVSTFIEFVQDCMNQATAN